MGKRLEVEMRLYDMIYEAAVVHGIKEEEAGKIGVESVKLLNDPEALSWLVVKYFREWLQKVVKQDDQITDS